ncbi:hypothetical protein AB1K91_17985 [Terribacillus sp. 179-K 1B1 HS]|uniref:hypothetical protein n=1 Tax=Terribacillus sp. 179-K 1B1 HS TaxID=3142388 RepID=UPI0039A001B2
MTEAEMNEQIQAESEATVHWIEVTLVAYAIAQFGATRLQVNDILADFAKQDGTIADNRVLSLLRKMDEIDADLRRIGEETISDVVTRVSERQVKTIAKALRPFGDEIKEKAVVRETLKYVKAGAFSNDMPLSKRVWGVSGGITDRLRTELRQGITRGESVNQLQKRVRGVYDAGTYPIRRLVVTEGNVAQRKVTAESAKRSRVVAGLRITDHPGHANHTEHRCYEMAREDSYGLGVGVYPVDNEEVLKPHIQCTSTLSYVLKDEVTQVA